jgi:molybdenum cofactor cytidylyltransferase
VSAGICGILLAAGAGKRFGGDKLLHPLADGTPLVVAAARRLAAAVPEAIAVVRPGAPELAGRLAACGLRVLENAGASAGMGGSLAHGVSATADAAGWVVALGDMPWISASAVARVADVLHRGAGIAVPVYRGRRGHPVGFAATYFDELVALRGDQGGRVIIARHAGDVVTVDISDPGVLRDVDGPADLDQRGTGH